MSKPTSGRRTVFVTGGSRGIGLATARTLLDAGYRVVAVSRSRTEEFECLESKSEGRLSLKEADLTSSADCHQVASQLRTCDDLYALVNNAGTAVSALHVATPPAAMVRMWNLNVLAPFLLCQAAVKAMCLVREGRIVNVSSITAHKAFRGLAAYTATKAALEGFSRVLAAEAGAWGITVNCVAPGFVETELTAQIPAELRAKINRRNALNRHIEVGDVAEVIKFLLSPGAATLTGEVIRIDAGAVV
jgi:3-oxoacyl-[acyl-carrier protein] reductase